MDFRQNQATKETAQQRLKALQRKSVRISITVSHALHAALQRLSDEQGRSLSNLAAYLLETANEGLKSTEQKAINPLR